jgi:transcriptional regulator with XRE-family HTH domain
VLRAARQARGMSQEDLAGEADIDRTYPSLLERGLREPTLDVFFRLCRAVRQPPAEVLNATLTELSRAQPLPAALRIALAPPRLPPSSTP